MQATKSRLSIDALKKGILDGDRIVLAKAITLMESSRPSDQELASELLDKILVNSGKSLRIGITGSPGVGKSTFIEALGQHITSQKKKLAVLTVDPSSQITGGSILGDKTRMEALAKNPFAFIRPSPAGQALGGVNNRTREAMLLCEAAGFEVIIIETVGVGQSEIAVKNMIDFFLLLLLAGAGDELQGIKKGIMEMADGMVITKADGDNLHHAKAAQAEYQHVLHLLTSSASGWNTRVLISSALTGEGIGDTWQMINEYYQLTKHSGYLEKNRQKQNISWLYESFNRLIKNEFNQFDLQKKFNALEEAVATQQTSAEKAAQQLLNAYHQFIKTHHP